MNLNYQRWILLFLAVVFPFITTCSAPSLKVKTYRIGRDPTWYPLNLMGKEPTVFAFSDDLIKAIAKKEGVSIDLYPATWESLIPSLDQGKVDAVLSSILPILQYKDLYSFSDPYLLIGPVLVVLKSSNVTSLAEMEGKIIGVQKGSGDIVLLEEYPGIVVHSYDQIINGLEDIVNHNIDGMLVPALAAYGYMRDIYQGSLKVATFPLTDEGFRLLTLKGKNEELIERFNEGLKESQSDGLYDQLAQKWQLK